MTPPRTLRVEQLEDRTVPATFGNPWPDGSHLTLSFAPDGTAISDSTSSLTSVLSALGNTAARAEILRAFQTWAVNANLNIGLVADSGAAFGTGGAIQSDARFGDIRIGARSLGADVVAITAPPNILSSYSGNVVLNADKPLSIGASSGYDLFTVFMQESGHAFGVGNSPDQNSVMYEYYGTARTALSSGDVAAIQGLYGARQADRWEGTSGNNTRATATSLTDPVEADLTNTTDVDFYRFSTPLLSSSSVVRLQAAGFSLALAKVDVLDSTGRVIASATASDIFNNNLTLNLSNLHGGSTYFVRVSSARSDVFGVGSYRLSVESKTLLGSLTNTVGGVVQLLDKELGLNDTLQAATKLVASLLPVDAGYDYLQRSSLSAANDVDFYKVTAPQGAAGGPLYLTGLVWAIDGTALDPRLDVYDAAGNLVASRILTNDDGSFVVQVENVQANSDYFVRVSSDSRRIGDYGLALNFQSVKETATLQAAGTLTSAHASTTSTLSVAQCGQFHFALAAGAAANVTLNLTVRDASGQLVFQLLTAAGDTRSGDVFLGAGTYSVSITATSTDGRPIPAVNYQLAAFLTSDPVGAQPVNNTSTPDSGGTTTGTEPSQGSPGATWTAQDSSDGSYWY